MSKEISNDIPSKYCAQFGRAAVEMGFITALQMNDALHIQSRGKDDAEGFRSLPTILFCLDWMTCVQIEQVLNLVLKKSQLDETNSGDARPYQND